MNAMKIGVFDSGVGGENVVEAVQKAFPSAEVIFRDDKKHLPYGDKSPEQILQYMIPIMNQLLTDNVDALVIACNTASTNVLPEIKHMMPIPVVGFVPMIKPASEQTETGTIIVCATPGTLRSKRYAELKEMYAKGVEVLEPDCSNWAMLIESNAMNRERLSEITKLAREKHADIIVLGCTHYHWIDDALQQQCGPDIQVIQPTDAVIRELKRVLRSD